MIDYRAIRDEVRASFRLPLHSIHGYEHWERVEGDAIKIARAEDAIFDVVRLFAILHDSRRLRDSHDPDHGRRAAEYAFQMRDRLFTLDDYAFELLTRALSFHADGYTSDDPTIGACWDADRLDLWRVGITPDASLFSTLTGRRLLEVRSKDPIWPRSLRASEWW